MIYDNILHAIGNTPIVRLNKFSQKGHAQILAKVEGLNVGGSIKTRTAFNMICDAENKGLISPKKTVIVEPSSGNQGIGLALVGAVKGYRTVIIMPDSVSAERRMLCALYGAKTILVHDNGNMASCMDNCIRLARNMKLENPNVFLPSQFHNHANVLAHKTSTAKEILRDVDGLLIDGLALGIGSGGTVTGVGEVLKMRFPNILVWGAEPLGCALFNRGKLGSHLQMGIGDGIVPPILNLSVLDKVVAVSDEDAISCCRDLARLEGISAGITSGTNLFVAKLLAKALGEGKTVLTIFPDSAERYFSTPLFAN